MNTSIARSETLLEVALAPMDMVRQVGLVIGFSLLNAVAAQVVIPIGPVPITGQTFAVLLTGALRGRLPPRQLPFDRETRRNHVVRKLPC